MNKTQQKAVRFAKTINDMIQNLEDNQQDMNEDFKRLKQALADGKVQDIPASDYWKIQEHFQSGTDSYKKQLKAMKKHPAPARVVGVTHQLIDAYGDFVKACQAMVDSMQDDRTIDANAFNQAEKDQDEATDKIGKYVQRITQLM